MKTSFPPYSIVSEVMKTNISEIFWSNYIDADSCDIDLEIKKLQGLIDKLEQKKLNLLTKNN